MDYVEFVRSVTFKNCAGRDWIYLYTKEELDQKFRDYRLEERQRLNSPWSKKDDQRIS